TSDTTISTVPTTLNRAGDFSDLRSSAGKPLSISAPASTAGTSRSPFSGNQIPLARFDPVALAAMNYYPIANRAGSAANANNFVGSSANLLNRDIVVARLDHQFRPADLFTARYYINNTGTNGIPASDPAGDITDVRVQSMLGALTHIFRPNLVNELRLTYLRRKYLDTRPGYDENLAGAIGLKGVSNAAFPAFTIPGYAALGNSTAVYRFQTPILDRQILDSLS